MPRTLLFLTGAQGSGKSTAIDWIVDQGLATRLKPFTTRAPRSNSDDEYHFYSTEAPPGQSEVAWSIERSNATYGMLRSELDRADAGDIAVTVFDPDHLNTLSKFRASTHHEVVVIGLDTVDTIEEQQRRTGNDKSRRTTPEALTALRAELRKLDVCLSGDAEVVRSALRAICQILTSRGGILPREYLMPLMHAGSVLSGWEEAQVQPSSYDLRVGDEIWCQGKFHQLNADNPIFSIPAYSYAIVKASERAKLPTFVAATFDIRVSHFLSGAILSNGPQVDPGYEGDLFCMIFNGNNSALPLRRADHFATLQFFTVARATGSYRGVYSMRDRLSQHMPLHASTGKGGQLVEQLRQEFDKELTGTKAHVSSIGAAVFALFAFVLWGLTAGWGVVKDAHQATLDVQEALEDLRDETSEEPAEPARPGPAIEPERSKQR